MKLNSERFSLGPAIEEVCSVAKPIEGEKTIHLAVDIAPELGEITLDRRKFKQVLYNLLSNAVKFSVDGGKVEIFVTTHDEHRFKLLVKDSGIGIKPEDIQRLFKEFEQLDSGASGQHRGTGLGLVLTRKLVELQGGTIGVESEVGRGSRFSIVLPLVMAEGSA